MKRNLEIKIAYWYYTLGLTQDEIARRLSMTRQKVNQMIRSLESQGIISISIHGFERDHIALESRLEEQFNLNEVLVVSDYGEKETAIYRVANVAAQYLDEIITQGMRIGVSWGRTLSRVISELPYHSRPDCSVVQLLGARNTAISSEKSDEISRNLANRLDCPCYMLYAPAIVNHPETRTWLMREENIRQSFELMQQCDLALVGVGELTDTSTLVKGGYVSAAEAEQLKESGFSADMNMNLICQDGTTRDNPFESRIMAADLDCLRQIRNTVAVAAGETKAEAAAACFRTGAVNTAIIDESLARRILEQC